MAKKKEVFGSDVVEKAIGLTQDSAKTALKGAVDTAELTEGYVQGLYKVGYDTNVEGLKIAKNYWDAASKIRQDWIKLFAATGEHLIETAGSVELPFQDQVADFGKGIYKNVEKTIESVTPKAKAAAK